MTLKQLEELSPVELLILQKHLKLGTEHLGKILSPSEKEEILTLDTQLQQVSKEMYSDKAEITSNITLVVNTILTSVLGGWMGLASFLNLRLDSFVSFCAILLFACLLGAWVGRKNFEHVKRAAKQAIDKKRLQNLELATLDTLKRKRHEEIIGLIGDLSRSVCSLGLKDIPLPSYLENLEIDESGFVWLSELIQAIQNDELSNRENYQTLLSEIEAFRQSYTKKVVDLLPSDKARERRGMATLFRLLYAPLQPTPKITSWLKANYKSLPFTALPTVIGGLSSLFVYLEGIPNISKEMGHRALFQFFTHPYVKIVELCLAVIITMYFGFAFFHMNRKKFYRDREIAKTNLRIIQEEKNLSLLEDKLLKVKLLHEGIIRIIHTFHALKENFVEADRKV